MMDLLLATSGGEAQAASGGYVDDVFSAYTYTGNGSTQTINNGIDLAGKGGLVWIKSRSVAHSHWLTDTNRGVDKSIRTNETGAELTGSVRVSGVNSNGFDLGNTTDTNASGENLVAWTFRKAPKFFDIVTYTGNGASNRQIPHSLGVAPGMVIVKRADGNTNWAVYHKGITATSAIYLDSVNGAFTIGTVWNNTEPTSEMLTLGNSPLVNLSGGLYVAYLFAHDPSADGIIQCGSFTTDASGNATVNLGWEPQFLITKSSSSEAAGGWNIFDQSRNFIDHANYTNLSNRLFANTSAAELVNSVYQSPTATGSNCRLSASVDTYIYLAIRRPNKPPTTGTQVYNAIARTGTGAAATVTGVGFTPDWVLGNHRNGTNGKSIYDRLRGATKGLLTWTTSAEITNSDAVTAFGMDGLTLGADTSTGGALNASGQSYINWFFRRAPGFFDVVCDTGTGVAHSVNHGLSATPEFIIRKSRSGATQWECWHSALAATEKLVLNSTAAKATDATAWNSTFPTSTQFTVGTGANVNTNAATYVTYLFATLAGISKVGSYTGNGTSQTINCGFATGARFILVKRTDAAGDWYVWDSARGIIAANDPHLSLNTTAIEVTTDDSVDPDASGFIVNQNTATNINVNGGQYIFLAIA